VNLSVSLLLYYFFKYFYNLSLMLGYGHISPKNCIGIRNIIKEFFYQE